MSFNERALEREEQALADDYSAGRISLSEYNEGMRELQRDVRAAYEEDQQDALDRVRNDWGW